MESIYWVFTLKCNDYCAHCYNSSGPEGHSVETDELLRVVPNLPDEAGRIILSGGEPLAEFDKLMTLVHALKEKYEGRTPIWLQTNGDLMDETILGDLLDAGISRIDVSSADRFHKHKGKRISRLREWFTASGMKDAETAGLGKTDEKAPVLYAFWGATEDLWLGGNWARGRALKNGLSLLDPSHNFCNIWSGAVGFLDHGSDHQEVHIQLYNLFPCCPSTLYALGDVREEALLDILDRYADKEVYRVLNRGDIHSLGLSAGLSPEFIRSRIEALRDVCLWCDEYFRKYDVDVKGENRYG